MSVQINDKELHAVTALAASTRYQYFLNKIADWEEIWSVCNDNGWALATDGVSELVPVWPAEAFAKACCLGEWQLNRPKAIELEAWIERWIPGLTRDNRKVAVFPLPSDQGIVMSADRFGADIAKALEVYE